MICAGGESELVFWDLRKLKVALNYRDSHTDDVTAVHFHKSDPNWLLTCSTDNLMNHFNWTDKPSTSEEDVLEGVYSSEQPLIDCGFINKDLLWTLTSVNTVEVVTVLDFDPHSKITKFPHQVDYVIGCGQDRISPEGKFIIYAGNNRGEVYIYEMTGKNEIALAGMILSESETIVRNCLRVSPDTIALTTENGDLKVYNYQAQAQQESLMHEL